VSRQARELWEAASAAEGRQGGAVAPQLRAQAAHMPLRVGRPQQHEHCDSAHAVTSHQQYATRYVAAGLTRIALEQQHHDVRLRHKGHGVGAHGNTATALTLLAALLACRLAGNLQGPEGAGHAGEGGLSTQHRTRAGLV
jgi:hypothetical protein